MTKNEFLNGLKKALANSLDNSKVQSHVNYYTDYINSEIKNGRRESEVIAELGDPWAIAKTIIASEEINSDGYADYSEVSSKRNSNEGRQKARVHVFGFDTWWKKLLLILGIIGIIMIVVAVIGGIVSLLLPVVVPVVAVLFVLRLFRKRQ